MFIYVLQTLLKECGLEDFGKISMKAAFEK